ncbi:MAG: hypothetical protein AB7I18_01880 [Candidatus Berkiella sp.]
MLGASFTPYHQLFDLDTQKTAFTTALQNNNRALAQFLYQNLLNAFKSTHDNFLPEIKNYFLWLAHDIAPHCQLETMLFLCNLRCDGERIMSMNSDQYITLMIATNDQPTFLYFLATSNLTLTQLAPYVDAMSDTKLQAIENLFAEANDLQPVQPRMGNGHRAG